jgi:hypothetical protein
LTVARAAIKCSLKVLMARLMALTRWLCGGTNRIVILLARMCFSTALEFVIHDVQCWLVVLSAQNSKDFGEGGNERGVSARGHWVDNDGVEVIDVGNEDVNHVLE